jgi:hypothetical protein
MALGSTQPQTEMSTRSISWGKGGQWVRLTTLPPSCAVVMCNLGTLTSWNPPDHSRPLMGLLYLVWYTEPSDCSFMTYCVGPGRTGLFLLMFNNACCVNFK